jgi:glycosyltransferase involved in cell wall biosynthesis
VRIALLSSYTPFVQGGDRQIVDWLATTLERRGHDVECIYLPSFPWEDRVLQEMAAFRCVDLSAADRVICFRPPAHVVDHPVKVLWFIHHVREFYEYWGTEYSIIPDDPAHRGLRDRIQTIDTSAMSEAHAVFTNSETVTNRLLEFNAMKSEVLYPPLLDPERFRCDGSNDEILCVGRVEPAKRQHLLVEALGHTTSPVRLRLSGVSQNPDYADYVRHLISSQALDDRVSFDNRWIDDAEKIDQLAACLASAYVPFNEDSYGYSPLEASHSCKATLTTTDSGGVTELVVDGYNGFVVEPDPRMLAERIDQLFVDADHTRQMGRAARRRVVDELCIDWDHVVERLLS